MKKDNAKQQYRVNEQIRVREVRIVGDGIESSVMPTRNALHLAEQKGVDLVEISPNAQPPVCRLIDYSKFLYQQKKHQKEMKAKQVKVDVKEIRFGPQTDDHDYEFKFKEQGEVLLLRFAADLEEYGKVEQMPQLEGKRMIMFIAPKKQPQASKKVLESTLNEKPADETPREKKAPQQKARKEYTGPKVEGEDFDD